MSYAEAVGANAVFIGAHSLDYSGYPDCRPEYFDAFNELSKLANKAGVEGKPIKIHAPLVGWNKTKIIETGVDLKAPFQATWSCYEGGEMACGACDSCILRRRAFEEAGVRDPVPYMPEGGLPKPAKKAVKPKAA
jgi:7-cyano-7-deazaguanine synthase